MQQMFKLYYREHGARLVDQLIAPKPFRLEHLPSNSVMHVMPSPGGLPDVDPSALYFQGYQKKIQLEIVTDYVEPEGPFRIPSFNVSTLTMAFRQANRNNWALNEKPWLVEKTPTALIVENYGYLDEIYRYADVQMTPYYKWANRYRTMWAKVNEIAETCDRHQFLFYPIPMALQGKTILDRFTEQPPSTQLVSIVGSSGEEGYAQLDLWKWLNPKSRNKSLMSMIDPKNYGKVNLVFVNSLGKQLLVNLGYLNSWIKGQTNTTDFKSIVQLSPDLMQKVSLKFSMVMNSVLENGEALDVLPEVDGTPETSEGTSVENSEADPDQTSQEREEIDTDDVSVVTSDDMELDASVGMALRKVLKTQEKPKTDKDIEHYENLIAKAAATSSIMSEIAKDIEKDVAALDRLNLTQLRDSGKSVKAPEMEEPETEPEIDVAALREKIYADLPPDVRLKQKLREDAEANLMTAADYRKLEQTIDAFQASTDPYGSGKKRVEAAVIVPEDLTITKESSHIPTSDSVPDKTMTNSTLKAYDRDYVRKLHKKDVLNAIAAISNAGVVVKAHEIEVQESILGRYEHHILELRPIDGAPSTIKFTLPIVDEDGTMMVAGTKYLLRKQRVDAVLRKISPRIVALSTYYGKTFVQMNTKVVNDDIAWIRRQINLASLTQGAHINTVTPGEVFKNDFKSPYIYGALGEEYAQLSVGTNVLFFDPTERLKRLPEETVARIEKEGRVFCGLTKSNQPIVVTKDNHFVVITNDSENNLGDIYTFFELDRSKAPINFSEIRVFSKYIPIGVVLGYYLGFRALIALLGEEYRVVEGRKSKNLADNEYAIVFKDKSYIFKTTNQKNTQILSGFLDFDKITKVYESGEFDHKAVYLNLLMAKKMGAIYVRELDMMETSFIDPISKDLLKAMNEPTTFTGLIIRATELLTIYTNPASQDRSVMRERGYERFAGTVYSETMRAIRQFRNKNLVGRSKVDMSPYQVWNTIMQDNSLKIVEDINPVQNLKEQEVMTYAGTGGRDKDTMTKPSRAFHPSDFGVVSESTVDNASVGTIAYLSANPNICDLRGKMSDEKDVNPTTVLSTSALISPCSVNDN